MSLARDACSRFGCRATHQANARGLRGRDDNLWGDGPESARSKKRLRTLRGKTASRGNLNSPWVRECSVCPNPTISARSRMRLRGSFGYHGNSTTNIQRRLFSVGVVVSDLPPRPAGFQAVLRVPRTEGRPRISASFRYRSIFIRSLFSKNSGEPCRSGTCRT